MGRHPKPVAQKMTTGTYRPDRDRSQTVPETREKPEAPANIGKRGQSFWADAYSLPWVTKADQTLVQLVAEKLDEREKVAEVFHQDPQDFRQQRTLKEIDRDIASGLDQLLMTPNARRRTGFEVTPTAQAKPTKIELLMSMRDGTLSREEYEAEHDRHYPGESSRERSRTDQLQLLADASADRLESLMNPGGA
jgi:hypothetical protein